MNNIPVLHVSGESLALTYEAALVKLYQEGTRFKTQYDKPGDPLSMDCTLNATILNPESDPMIHQAFPGGIDESKEYVMAAKAVGARDVTIIFRHILPNALVPVITFAPFSLVGNIFALTSLDFLGFGLPAPTPSWGELMGQGMGNISSYWLSLSPIGALFFTLLLVTFIGEAAREALDPKELNSLISK